MMIQALPKRIQNLLKCGALVLLLGVGARIYAELNGPQRHPLPLRLTKNYSANAYGMRKGSKSLRLPLKLSGRPDVRERPLEGPRCKWVLQALEHRDSAREPWRVYSLPGNASALQGSGDQAMLWFPGVPGEWKARVHAEAEYWDGETKDLWRGDLTQEFQESFSAADLARIAAEEKESTRLALIEAAKPPKGAIVLVKGKKYISKLQYTDNGEPPHWKDVPTPGNPQYPLLVDQYSVIGFRAVRVNPKEEWPDYPEFMPRWTQNNDGANYLGESVYLYFNLERAKAGVAPEERLETVTVRCGNQLSTQVRVLPSGGGNMLFISDKKDLALGQSGRFAQIRLTLRSDHTEPQYKNARFRLSAQYTDGTRADLINAPGNQDDTLTIDAQRFAYATLHAGRKVGKILLSATLVGPDGKTVLGTAQGLEVEVHANWWAREQEASR